MTLLTIFSALLIDIFAFTIILPLFPRLLAYYATNPSWLYVCVQEVMTRFKEIIHLNSTKFDSVLYGGLVASAFSLLQCVSSPVIARASDKYGRRPILLLTMVPFTHNERRINK